MKKVIKKILKLIGLLKYATKINLLILDKIEEYKKNRTKKIKEWNLEIDELNLTFDTTDPHSNSWFYPRYFNGVIHEPTATKIFIEYINDDSIVFDIGAHIGYFTCIAGKLAKNGNVYAFEVDKKCISLIKKNLDKNNLTNVFVHNKAVSDKTDKIAIPNLDKPNPSLVILPKSNDEISLVESISIDDFVLRNHFTPDFIKIDVEGAEGLVLNGMKELLKSDNLKLLIEIHVNNLIEQFNTDYKEIIKLLINSNFIIYNVEHRTNNSDFIKIDERSELKNDTMIFCVKKEI